MIQINLNKVNWWKLSTIILAVAVLFLIPKNCDKSEPSFATVKVPEVKGEFKTDTIEVQKTVYIPKPFKDHSNEEKLKNDISSLNTQLELYKEELDNAIDEFTYLDSINKINAYADAIALREFNQPFEDDFIKIENSGYTFGTLKSLKTSYIIKEREVSVKVPKTYFKMSLGAFGGSNTDLNQWIYGANLTANKTSINYIRIGSENFGTIGYNFNFFELKR